MPYLDEIVKLREPYPATAEYKKMIELQDIFTNHRASYEDAQKIFKSVDEDFTEEECSWLVKATQNFPEIDFSKIVVTVDYARCAFSTTEQTIYMSPMKLIGNNGVYFFYILCHEMQHIVQSIKGVFWTGEGRAQWTGEDPLTIMVDQVYDLMKWRDVASMTQYNMLPWEADANAVAFSIVTNNNLELPDYISNNPCIRVARETAKKGF